MEARVIGVGSYIGEETVTNKDLEGKITGYDSSSGDFSAWVERVSEIQERRYSSLSVEEMAVLALEECLKSCNVSSKEIDLLILNTFGNTLPCPNISQRVGKIIGNLSLIPKQINNACAGFVYGVKEAYHTLISDPYIKTVAVVSADKLSERCNYSDPKSAVLFGDGAGAVILQRSDEPGILGVPFVTGEYSDQIKIDTYIEMPGGPRIMRAAVDAMVIAAEKALERTELKKEEVDFFIPHQANGRILRNLAKQLNLEEKMLSTLAHEGNLSGASMMRTFDTYVKNGTIKRGDVVLFTAVGGGYCSGAFVMRY